MQLQFGEFSLDTDRRELSRGGAAVHLTTKALQLLTLLVVHRPAVLPKERIYGELWPDTYVEESNLSVLISEVRAALGDDARHPHFIKTGHGFGYGFVADAKRAAEPAPIRLRSGGREFDLVDGENIVGRDAAAEVRLAFPGISRRHARIIVTGARATIEDLGSKNGTYVGGHRIDGATPLHDGDEIRVSRELLVVVAANGSGSTMTDIES